MIFCASAVKDLYLAPVEHYGPDLVHVFVSDRGGWTSSCDNAHGGVGVGWAFGKSEAEIRRLAPQKFEEFAKMTKARPAP